jgi:hypothetical protein
MKKTFLLLLSAILFSSSALAISAKQALIQNAINKHEKNILAAMKKKNASQDEIFETYVLAANEMKAYSAFKFARQFYYKAIDLDGVTVDKSRLFFSLINMDLLEGKSGKDSYDELIHYQKKHKVKDRKFVNLTAHYYKVLINQKLSSEVLSKTELQEIEKDFTYFTPLKWNDIQIHVSRKDFKKALELLSTMDMNRAPINQKIISDLVTVKTEEKSNKTNPLLCEPQFKKYPGSQSASYTMKLCKILLDDRFGKGFNPSDVEKLAKLIEQKAPTQKFLLDALK